MLIRLIKWLWRFFTKPFRILFTRFMKIYYRAEDRVNKNIRMELIVTFGVCLFASFMLFTLTNSYFTKRTSYSTINYMDSIKRMSDLVLDIGKQVDNIKVSSKDSDKIKQVINRYSNTNYKVLVVDLNGKVLYKSENTYENQVDIHTIIKNSVGFKNAIYDQREYSSGSGEFVSFYPIDFSDNRAYVVIKGVPEGRIETNYNEKEKSFLALLISGVFFIGLFFYLTGKKVKYMQEIALAVMYMANGDLNYRIDGKGEDELAHLADNINYMAAELNYKIEKEREIERNKSELITNVSHDLRTPLTSIIGYLNLIKDNKFRDDKQLKEYVNIAYNKSEKLKVLIDELFEYTKLSGEGVTLNKEVISLDEFLEQLVEEFVPVFEDNKLIANKNITKDVKINADGDKLVRVFDNLIMNAVRYSFKPGEIKIGLYKEENKAIVYVKNKGKNIPNEDLKKLFHRFYRVEKSRSENTGGTGLGLAISKSIVNLHNGEIWVECDENDISFYVKLPIE
ncbi:sensor histidine kinase [Clostridium rectalis]|uniref:sensor histidine kinase n=1 Tax=Clostridium rectalis TaxID=2040295 RepID=UPI000F641FB8|nr:HAMP domain-containing sensor histidine kinase [Clostridium rectalis]